MKGKIEDTLETFESIFFGAFSFQKRGILKKFLKLHAIYKHALLSSIRRGWTQRKADFPVPIAMALSPTMRCNLSCAGCYAHDYPRNNELSLDEIDGMLTSAERMGVFLFVITGGEPLMKDGILDIFHKHRRLLFLMVTNGELIDIKTARKIANARNIMPVVSLEGTQEQTDIRRGKGVYEHVRRAMRNLQNADVIFGFSAMVTHENHETLGSVQFIDEMIARGCVLGFYTEYIPIGDLADWDMVMDEEDRKAFRARVLEFRRRKPIMVVHLPDDEYGRKSVCQAVIGGCVHINAQGYVEPCPFAHFASDNIREKGLESALRSEFLSQIRSSEAIIRRGCIGCALFENMEVLQAIADKTGAKPTDDLITEGIQEA